MEPVQTFTFMDEHYFVHCEHEWTQVFLYSESLDGRAIAGWRHKVGSGIE